MRHDEGNKKRVRRRWTLCQSVRKWETEITKKNTQTLLPAHDEEHFDSLLVSSEDDDDLLFCNRARLLVFVTCLPVILLLMTLSHVVPFVSSLSCHIQRVNLFWLAYSRSNWRFQTRIFRSSAWLWVSLRRPSSGEWMESKCQTTFDGSKSSLFRTRRGLERLESSMFPLWRFRYSQCNTLN